MLLFGMYYRTPNVLSKNIPVLSACLSLYSVDSF